MIDLGLVFTQFTALINRRLGGQTGAREIAYRWLFTCKFKTVV